MIVGTPPSYGYGQGTAAYVDTGLPGTVYPPVPYPAQMYGRPHAADLAGFDLRAYVSNGSPLRLSSAEMAGLSPAQAKVIATAVRILETKVPQRYTDADKATLSAALQIGQMMNSNNAPATTMGDWSDIVGAIQSAIGKVTTIATDVQNVARAVSTAGTATQVVVQKAATSGGNLLQPSPADIAAQQIDVASLLGGSYMPYLVVGGALLAIVVLARR